MYFQAGSVHVRVRRDADEQMVLAHVYNRLSNLISVLTVQIFKDDWSRPSAFQILGDSTLVTKVDRPLVPPSGSAVTAHTVGSSSYVGPALQQMPGYGQQYASPPYR